MSGDSSSVFTPIEIDTIGEIMNISMGSAATAASTLLDNKVTITTPVVNVVPSEEFSIERLDPAIAVEIQYVEGISGSNILILKRSDVRAILSQMMMVELPEDFAVDDMAESAICELMNQMMGSSATVLSCFLGRTINISTPRTVPIDELETFKKTYFDGEDAIVTIEFTLTIKDTIESVFLSAMKVELAKEIIDVSLNFDSGDEGGEEMAPPPPPTPSVPEPEMQAPPPAPQQIPQAPTAVQPQQMPGAPQAPPQPMAPQEMGQQVPAYPGQPPAYPAPQQPYPYGQQQAPGYGGYPYPAQQPQAQYAPPPPSYEQQQPVTVKDYNYGDFGQGMPSGQDHPLNMDLVMNVPVVMTVELGRTRRKIKEILEFGQGTIVELDKQAGSQVDVIVNGQLIARGDVVVVDDNFSIRITEIVKNTDPLSML